MDQTSRGSCPDSTDEADAGRITAPTAASTASDAHRRHGCSVLLLRPPQHTHNTTRHISTGDSARQRALFRQLCLCCGMCSVQTTMPLLWHASACTALAWHVSVQTTMPLLWHASACTASNTHMPWADSTQSPRVEQALRVRLDEVASFLFARRFAHVARLLHTYVAA